MNRYKKVVVKIGSALITAGGRGLDRAMITTWAEQMARLREAGVDVVLVSSGSIAEGISRLGLKSRPQNISELQAHLPDRGGRLQLGDILRPCLQAKTGNALGDGARGNQHDVDAILAQPGHLLGPGGNHRAIEPLTAGGDQGRADFDDDFFITIHWLRGNS